MRYVGILIALILCALVVCGALGAAEITGPDVVPACSGTLVEVSAVSSFPNGKVRLKVRRPTDLDYRMIGGTMVFAAGPVRTIEIDAIDLVILESGDFDFDISTKIIRVTSDGGAPGPGPGPGPGDPIPPQPIDIAGKVALLTKSVDISARGKSTEIASIYEAMAALPVSDYNALISEIQSRTRSLLMDMQTRNAWLDWFRGVYELGKDIKDVASKKAFYAEVAKGLRLSSAATSQARTMLRSLPGIVTGVQLYNSKGVRPATMCEKNGMCIPDDGTLMVAP